MMGKRKGEGSTLDIGPPQPSFRQARTGGYDEENQFILLIKVFPQSAGEDWTSPTAFRVIKL